jgi:hypothetical protein
VSRDTVVAVQLPLLVFRKLTVGRHRRRPFDQRLVEGHPDGVAFLACANQGHEGWGSAGSAGLKECPLWLAGGIVQVDHLDAASGFAIVVHKRAALPTVGYIWSRKGHGGLQLKGAGCAEWRLARDRTPRWLAVLCRCWLTVEQPRKPAIRARIGCRVRREPERRRIAAV